MPILAPPESGSSLPIPRLFWPLTVGTSNRTLSVIYHPLNSGDVPLSVQIEIGIYRSPEALAEEVASKLGTMAATTAIATVAPNGYLAITVDSLGDGDAYTVTPTALSRLLGFGESPIGFGEAGNEVLMAAPHQMRYFWTPGMPVASDTRDQERHEVSVVIAHGGQNATDQFGGPLIRRTVAFTHIHPGKIRRALEDEAHIGHALERMWDTGGIARFRYWPDRKVLSTNADYFLTEASASGIQSTRLQLALDLHEFVLEFGRWVP